MKLLAGLGNYSKKYEFSRHNLGFLCIDFIIKNLNLKYKNSFRLKSKIALYEDMVICKPKSFMNVTGTVIKKVIDFYKIELSDFLVILDDLNLEFKRVKFKIKGSSGGHKGLESLIRALKSMDFARIRIGIGRPSDSREFKDYVLSNFTQKELEELNKEVFPKILEGILIWKKEGLLKAQSFINSN